MMNLMSDYEIIDYLLLNFVEPGDIINIANQDYLVKEIEAAPEGWDLVVVDRYEEELELSLPDGIVVGLCDNNWQIT